MIHLASIGGLTALVLLIGGLSFGWPGEWAPLALAPGVLLGATLAHLIGVKRQLHPVRPGVIALGVAFGMMGAVVALAVFRASAAPPDIVIRAERTVNLPAADVWRVAGDPLRRPEWIGWLQDLEPIGRGGPEVPGSRYRASLELEMRDIPAEHIILRRDEGPAVKEVAWRVEVTTGQTVTDLEESVRVTASEDGRASTVTYTVRWHAPEMMDRLSSGLYLTPVVTELTKQSLDSLARAGDW